MVNQSCRWLKQEEIDVWASGSWRGAGLGKCVAHPLSSAGFWAEFRGINKGEREPKGSFLGFDFCFPSQYSSTVRLLLPMRGCTSTSSGQHAGEETAASSCAAHPHLINLCLGWKETRKRRENMSLRGQREGCLPHGWHSTHSRRA